MTKGTMAKAKASKKELIADIQAVAGKNRAITRAEYILNGQFKKAYETYFETFEQFRSAAKLVAPKDLVDGKQRVAERKEPLPEKGKVARYIISSAQNNTKVHKEFWANVKALAAHYDAKIMIGTFSYNQNQYGELAVKLGKKNPHQRTLWFDADIADYLNDERVELAPGLVWCGDQNIMPTEENPLSGLESFAHGKSAIFPHTKIEMRSIAVPEGMPVKMNYTTGAVTQLNYIQKKAGLKAEHHHRYSFLVVEVDDQGTWFVRQVSARKNGRNIQDLNVEVEDGVVVSTDAKVDAITWGDLHATNSQPEVVDASQIMLDELHPKYQFIHDVMEGVSINRHYIKAAPLPHLFFHRWLRGLHRVEDELKRTRATAERYLRPWCTTVAPDANHDAAWLQSWLNKYDYRYDPANAEIFLRLQLFMYEQIRSGKLPKKVNIMQRVMETEAGMTPGAMKFLLPDESFVVGEVECGQHGHLGPNGNFGNPANLSKIGKKMTTAHTHSAGIYHGLFVAGTSSKLTEGWDYTSGPSNWGWSHVVQYSNGQRAIVTMKIVDGVARWRA
jgi:hypothetical protein